MVAETMGHVDVYDTVIVGGGPAGLSAAIYVARYNRRAVVIDSWRGGRWQSHEVNENYLGFPAGVAAKRLRERGRRQAERFGVAFCRAKVKSVRKDDGVFVAQAGRHTFRGKTVILATGVSDNLPDIGNTEEYWGKSLFWCITCDGWKVRDARVAIVGKDDEAAITAMQFLNFTERIAFVTNCSPEECQFTDDGRKRLESAGIPIHTGPISHVEGDDGHMEAVVLMGGEKIETDFMFNQQGCQPHTDLAVQLGVKLADNGFIETDEEQRTNVKVVYAAGDVTRLFAHQIVTAAHEGATAGITANYDLYRPEQKH
jgi:thioredoxin reductase (NADPH)